MLDYLECAKNFTAVSSKFTEEYLVKFAKENKGVVDLSNQLEKISKITDIAEAVMALDVLKKDLLCLIKKEARARDQEYQKAYTAISRHWEDMKDA